MVPRRAHKVLRWDGCPTATTSGPRPELAHAMIPLTFNRVGPMTFIPDFKSASQLIDQSLTARLGDDKVDLVCQTVESVYAPEGFEGYSMIFKGPLDRGFEQQMLTFEHPDLKDVVLFLVPINQVDDGYLYEAVINREVS